MSTDSDGVPQLHRSVDPERPVEHTPQADFEFASSTSDEVMVPPSIEKRHRKVLRVLQMKDEEIAALLKMVSQLQQTASDEETRRVAADKRVRVEETRAERMESQLRSVQVQFERLCGVDEQRQREREHDRQRADTLAAELVQVHASCDEAVAAVERHRGAATRAQTALRETEQQLGNWRQRVNECDAAQQAHTALVARLQSQVQTLEERAVHAEGVAEARQEELDEWQRRWKSMRSAVERDVAESSGSIERLRAQLKQSKTAHERVLKSEQSLREQLQRTKEKAQAECAEAVRQHNETLARLEEAHRTSNEARERQRSENRVDVDTQVTPTLITESIAVGTAIPEVSFDTEEGCLPLRTPHELSWLVVHRLRERVWVAERSADVWRMRLLACDTREQTRGHESSQQLDTVSRRYEEQLKGLRARVAVAERCRATAEMQLVDAREQSRRRSEQLEAEQRRTVALVAQERVRVERLRARLRAALGLTVDEIEEEQEAEEEGAAEDTTTTTTTTMLDRRVHELETQLRSAQRDTSESASAADALARECDRLRDEMAVVAEAARERERAEASRRDEEEVQRERDLAQLRESSTGLGSRLEKLFESLVSRSRALYEIFERYLGVVKEPETHRAHGELSRMLCELRDTVVSGDRTVVLLVPELAATRWEARRWRTVARAQRRFAFEQLQLRLTAEARAVWMEKRLASDQHRQDAFLSALASARLSAVERMRIQRDEALALAVDCERTAARLRSELRDVHCELVGRSSDGSNVAVGPQLRRLLLDETPATSDHASAESRPAEVLLEQLQHVERELELAVEAQCETTATKNALVNDTDAPSTPLVLPRVLPRRDFLDSDDDDPEWERDYGAARGYHPPRRSPGGGTASRVEAEELLRSEAVAERVTREVEEVRAEAAREIEQVRMEAHERIAEHDRRASAADDRVRALSHTEHRLLAVAAEREGERARLAVEVDQERARVSALRGALHDIVDRALPSTATMGTNGASGGLSREVLMKLYVRARLQHAQSETKDKKGHGASKGELRRLLEELDTAQRVIAVQRAHLDALAVGSTEREAGHATKLAGGKHCARSDPVARVTEQTRVVQLRAQLRLKNDRIDQLVASQRELVRVLKMKQDAGNVDYGQEAQIAIQLADRAEMERHLEGRPLPQSEKEDPELDDDNVRAMARQLAVAQTELKRMSDERDALERELRARCHDESFAVREVMAAAEQTTRQTVLAMEREREQEREKALNEVELSRADAMQARQEANELRAMVQAEQTEQAQEDARRRREEQVQEAQMQRERLTEMEVCLGQTHVKIEEDEDEEKEKEKEEEKEGDGAVAREQILRQEETSLLARVVMVEDDEETILTDASVCQMDMRSLPECAMSVASSQGSQEQHEHLLRTFDQALSHISDRLSDFQHGQLPESDSGSSCSVSEGGIISPTLRSLTEQLDAIGRDMKIGTSTSGSTSGCVSDTSSECASTCTLVDTVSQVSATIGRLERGVVGMVEAQERARVAQQEHERVQRRVMELEAELMTVRGDLHEEVAAREKIVGQLRRAQHEMGARQTQLREAHRQLGEAERERDAARKVGEEQAQALKQTQRNLQRKEKEWETQRREMRERESTEREATERIQSEMAKLKGRVRELSAEAKRKELLASGLRESRDAGVTEVKRLEETLCKCQRLLESTRAELRRSSVRVSALETQNEQLREEQRMNEREWQERESERARVCEKDKARLCEEQQVLAGELARERVHVMHLQRVIVSVAALLDERRRSRCRTVATPETSVLSSGSSEGEEEEEDAENNEEARVMLNLSPDEFALFMADAKQQHSKQQQSAEERGASEWSAWAASLTGEVHDCARAAQELIAGITQLIV